ncbi:MAG: tRNA pseudouridine(38-40) synthase TruA [Polyangia bacterium]|jgi:tRNA pseudouridine38-40 synthase|nr:tRNA pseudouridine(38-40) synthase TruA [Polyangia bacterium]
MAPERVIYLRLAYDGTRYAGWQIQPEEPTVQGVLMETLAVLEKAPVKVVGASRTDAGVHARGQGASFCTSSSIPPRGYLRGLNSLLPEDLAVREAREMPQGFHARFSARGKHYRYRIWNEERRDPLECRTAWHRLRALDLEAMARGAEHLVGRHDFESFRAASCDRENAVRELTRVEISADGPLVAVDVEGTAFLKHMVRILVGSLVEVGRGRRPPGWIAQALEQRNRASAGPTAPACGLCLERVFYDELA